MIDELKYFFSKKQIPVFFFFFFFFFGGEGVSLKRNKHQRSQWNLALAKFMKSFSK